MGWVLFVAAIVAWFFYFDRKRVGNWVGIGLAAVFAIVRIPVWVEDYAFSTEYLSDMFDPGDLVLSAVVGAASQVAMFVIVSAALGRLVFFLKTKIT